MNIKKCECGGFFEVSDSRLLPTGDISRKRTCSLCNKSFNTIEINREDLAEMVKKKTEAEEKYKELLERLKG